MLNIEQAYSRHSKMHKMPDLIILESKKSPPEYLWRMLSMLDVKKDQARRWPCRFDATVTIVTRDSWKWLPTFRPFEKRTDRKRL